MTQESKDSHQGWFQRELFQISECVRNTFGPIDFHGCRVLAHVHCFETSIPMFEALKNVGIQAKKIDIFPKPYSLTRTGNAAFKSSEFNVFQPSSHDIRVGYYDEWIRTELFKFVQDFKRVVTSSEFIILLDDGGQLTQIFLELLGDDTNRVISIQATASGLKGDFHRSCPVVGVASSPIKLSLEYPEICSAALECLGKELDIDRNLVFGIVGFGNLGREMSKILFETYRNVNYWDRDVDSEFHSAQRVGIYELLSESDIVVGCCGEDVSAALMGNFSKPISLFSLSSRDIEFRSLLRYSDLSFSLADQIYPKVNVSLKSGQSVTIMNAGFPMNFDRAQERERAERIFVTRALQLAGVIYGASILIDGKKSGFFQLPKEVEEAIRLAVRL